MPLRSHPIRRLSTSQHLLTRVAQHSQSQPQQALRWFARAREHEKTRDEAQTWFDYIQRELQPGWVASSQLSPDP